MQEVDVTPDFFYGAHSTGVFCDGPVHDQPEQKQIDKKLRAQLAEAGYRVIVIQHSRDLEDQIAEHTDIFGEGNRSQ